MGLINVRLSVTVTPKSNRLLFYISDSATARGVDFGAGQTDEVSLLSPQSTHLSSPRMRYSTGTSW